MRLVNPLAFIAISALACLAFASTPDEISRPTLELERGPDRTRVWVEGASGESGRHLLRETESPVANQRAGAGPAGRALFAIWDESGRRWFAYSRDAGASWSDGRPLATELRLRDGDVLPGRPLPEVPDDHALPAGGRLFLVQFRTLGLPEWRDALRGLGVEVLGHVPHNAHIVRGDAAALAAAAGFDFVERVEPFHPWYRLDPEMRAWLSDTGATAAERRLRVTALEWGPEGKGRILAAAEALGARVAEYWPSGHVLELWVTRDQLGSLAALDDVAWIDAWTPPGQDMDLVREDAGSDWVEENFLYCGQGVHGEVMDGGIQSDHPDFDGVMLHGPFTLDSHGTATYGIVFGNGYRDGDGDPKGTGQMPCAGAQGIFADYGEVSDRFAHTQELKSAPYFASFQTNSWGSALTQAYTSFSQEMDDIIWQLDIAITQSQSNNGNQSSRPQAWAKNVISVGGIRHYDTLDTTDDAWASGASIGPAADGRIKPDVSYWYDDIYTTTINSDYRTEFGGTSAATPETAGVLGLIVQMWADNVWNTDPSGSTVFEKQPHFSTLKALLINNSRQYDFVGAADDLSRFKQGWGRPSAREAYERAVRSLVVDETVPLALSDSATYDVDVVPGETELKVTLVYADPPGTLSSSMHRINDLDLTVTSPSAMVYHGNFGLEDGPESLSGGSADTLNTVENVFVTNPEAGVWQITIEAVEINQDAHPATPTDDAAFALVVTGGADRYESGLGRIKFLRGIFGCGQAIELHVRDGNAGSSTLAVDVRSDTESVAESVVLEETLPGSGTFVGSIVSTSGAPAGGDGALSLSHGDVLTLGYVDADDGAGGTDVPMQATAVADCAAPVIFQIGESDIVGGEALVTWMTDEPATTRADFGDTLPPGQTAMNSGLTTFHQVKLAGLQECTVYHYSVESGDIVGNTTTDDNAGAYFHFETLGDFGSGPQACHAGQVAFEVAAIGCSSSLPIRLVDLDLNADPGLAETVSVSVTSTSEIVPESVVLVETGPNTSVFTGSIPTATGPANPADGALQVDHGDLLTASYADEDDGTGSAGFNYGTAAVDCVAPDHSSVTVTGITDGSATIEWTTSEPTTGYVDWGTSTTLGNVVPSNDLSTSHSVAIGSFAECATIHFRVVSTDAQGYTGVADVAGTPFTFDAYTVPGAIYSDGFETDLGWTLADEWEIGAPLGLGTAPGDPASAFAGSNVLGHDLSGQGANPGDYELGTNAAATSPVIDASSLANAELRLRRWLNVADRGVAYLEVTNLSGAWVSIWANSPFGGTSSSSWSDVSYNVSAYADGNPDFQFRFRQSIGATNQVDAGWNVDQLLLRDGSLPLFDSCSACDDAPTFAGVVSVVDDDPCADSGVTLSWADAAAWGDLSAGTYAVYRDSIVGFTPSVANLVAAGVAGTTWTDAAVPDDTDLYYVVRAENDESCGTGPNNNGAVDANLVYGTGRDETSQAVPGTIGDSLRVDPLSRAHARLTWSSSPTAAAYHVYRSASPDAGFDVVAEPDAALYEDEGALGDSQSWFYLVFPADACGNE